MLVVERDEDREENVCSIIKSSLVTVKLGFSIVERDEYYIEYKTDLVEVMERVSAPWLSSQL